MVRISVVVPSFNQGRFLEQCLHSIFDQQVPGVEVIVMDGGSSDESPAILRRFEDRIAYWQSGADGGQAAAINSGVARATGELVCWLNSDDLFCEDALALVSAAYAAHPGFGLYIGNGFRLDEASGRRTPFIARNLALQRRALREGLDYVLQPSTFFLREAWNRVGGLDPRLAYCMDWDLLLRIAKDHPAVLINEFLSCSREYAETKTSSGGLGRVAEICTMTSRHAGKPLTPGAAVYLFETLNVGLRGALAPELRQAIGELDSRSRDTLVPLAGYRDGFPCESDPQDVTFVPLAKEPGPTAPGPARADPQWPKFSIVMPSFNQDAYLERAIRSVFCQGYPNVEFIVIDGGSTDGSVAILQHYAPQLAHWESERDRGPAHAINKGFARATGEILGWLNSDDMLAEGALWSIARAFAGDPGINLVYGNALYVDAGDAPILMDHGAYRTSLYFGSMQSRDMVPAYWRYVHSIPQPTVYFRRDVLDRAGGLSESFKFIFDFELFFRFLPFARTRKIERTLAFYRIHSDAKTSSWQHFLIELYAFSRPWWPRAWGAAYTPFARSYARDLLDRCGIPRASLRYKIAVRLIAAATRIRSFNPERTALRYQTDREPGGRLAVPAVPAFRGDDAPEVPDSGVPAGASPRIVYCSFYLPRRPGLSGGEIRDYHLIRALQRLARITFFSIHNRSDDGRADSLAPRLHEYYDPERICRETPELVDEKILDPSLRRRLFARLTPSGIPSLRGPLTAEARAHAGYFRAYVAAALSGYLRREQPEFLIVSPQINIAALALRADLGSTRTILATYDVEHVRMRRIAESLRGARAILARREARRSMKFESRNLTVYDGVIAVSELDRSIFVSEYGVPPERVLALENGVDTGYFSGVRAPPSEVRAVVFVGSLGYRPNHLAALRLARDIMPLVWQAVPEAQAWIVGHGAQPELVSHSDGKRIFVTGPVEDVRPFLAAACVMCAPLEFGSGTKYKILEAMSAGVPVVCTSLAAEGLDLAAGSEVLVADDSRELANRIRDVLSNPELAASLARAGRRCVESRYSWESLLVKLEPWLRTIAALPARGR